MNSFDTKYLIAKTFIDLCDQSSIQKVSISDIVNKTGKNRKTFYYHFDDKNSLIMWIFRYDMGAILKEKFPESMLVYEDSSDDPKAHFPFYITKKSGVRSLNHAAFYDCFAKVLESRRKFYHQALLENGPQSLRNYLYDLYLPAMVNDINSLLYYLDYVYNISDDDNITSLYYYKQAGCLNEELKDYVSSLTKTKPQVLDVDLLRILHLLTQHLHERIGFLPRP